MVSARHYLCNLFIYHLKYNAINVVVFANYTAMIFIKTPCWATTTNHAHHGFNKIFFSKRESMSAIVFRRFIFVFYIYHRHHHGMDVLFGKCLYKKWNANIFISFPYRWQILNDIVFLLQQKQSLFYLLVLVLFRYTCIHICIKVEVKLWKLTSTKLLVSECNVVTLLCLSLCFSTYPTVPNFIHKHKY